MNNFVVLQWYYNGRDGTSILPELTYVFGPFVGMDEANQWKSTAPTWGGWGEYKYEIKKLVTPEANNVS